ncbi:MAG: heavy metal translocating P-type ATPase [Deltaproteobacteria bacterium]
MAEIQNREQFGIRGMHCAACSSRIEKVLANTEGIGHVTVNLAAETMDLTWNPALITLNDVAEKLQGLGFTLVMPAKKERVELAISGMTCASCSARIEKVIGAMEGVESMTVNLANERGVVIFDPDRCTLRQIRATFDKIGFSATPVSASGADFFRQQQQEAEAKVKAMRTRLLPSFIFTLFVLYLSMGEMIGMPLPGFLNPHFSPLAFALIQCAFVLPVMWIGRNFYLIGFPNLLRGTPNMDSLIAVGTGAAFIYSLWNLVEIYLGIEVMTRVMDLYFESAAVLIALVSLGKYLEAKSKVKTSDAIRQLMALTPDKAILLEKKEDKEVQTVILAEEIEPGDLLLIKPGDRIPVDGIIVAGKSSVDESMLTGESMPVWKKEGEKLAAGTLNKNGVLRMRAEKVGQDTVLARIIRMVREAQGSKAPIANLADRISLYFVPTVMVIATIAGLCWYFIGAAGFVFSLRIFIAVLVIACPCAMGLATPTSIMVGTGRGAQLGVLIKSGGALEMARNIKAIVFDKTGTLTYGKPKLTDLLVLDDNYDRDRLLLLAATAESGSEHPLAEAVLETARENGLAIGVAEKFEAVTGKGIRAMVEGRQIFLGNEKLMLDAGIVEQSISSAEEKVRRLAGEGKTALFMAVDRSLTCIIAIADRLKEEAPAIVRRLQKMGIRIYMLTGDHRSTAYAIASEAGISDILAEVLPEEKSEKVEELQNQGMSVAMIGDGINDAPALARADLGIAMGTGIDVAIETGDIVLMKGQLSGVIDALELSRATMRNIRQNLFWAFAYNIVGIPVAAGLLYIFGGPTLNPMIAGGAMALSSVSVVSNALRLRFFTPGQE